MHHTDDLGIGRHLAHVPELRARMLATTTRDLAAQAELRASTGDASDAGDVAPLAHAVPVGRRRVPGLTRDDDRVIRLREGRRHPGTFVVDWTSHEVRVRLLAHHRLAAADYRLSQLRADWGQLRAHGLVERRGTRRRSHLTPRGLKRGVLLGKLRTRRLGPLTTLAADPAPRRPTRAPSDGDVAVRQVDAARDHLCDARGLVAA